MKEFKIKKIDGYVYILEDSKNKEYNLNIEFYDIGIIPKAGDLIYLNEALLRETRVLNLGFMNNEYGRNIEEATDIDIVVINTGDKKLYLKRLYG